MDKYKQYNPIENARLALNYITSMVDKNADNLPYWLVLPHKKPAEAAHCRVDDAELVGSWYEGIDALRKMLKTDEGADVQESFKRHLMKSWGEHGLRFHEDYPWTHTNHSSFHEMGYILPALNRIIENEPGYEKAKTKAKDLIAGMRSLVVERKIKTFWSGDSPVGEKVYMFPNDVYLRDGGFDMTRFTGRGEQAIRNSVMLHALVRNYEITGDETALDLAEGTANYLLGPSRYFNYKMEFFGHVHSAGWVASGLVRLGRVAGNNKYIEKGKAIYDYIRSISSSFGWAPEYAQWHPMDEEHCETCCIKDMIECADELIQAGYDEYWNDMNLFARNQLIENQIAVSSYMVVDNTLKDTEGITYRDLDKRIIGGFTGGSLPNSISLSKFRSVAGCCVGMAPVALNIAWDRAMQFEDGTFIVNIQVDKETEQAIVKNFYPNEGKIQIKTKRKCHVGIRKYDWMNELEATIDGEKAYIIHQEGLALIKNVQEGAVVEFSHRLLTEKRQEKAAGRNFEVVWRGPDVVDILPRGEHLRLYQRINDVPKFIPKPEDVEYLGASNYGPTQQKK